MPVLSAMASFGTKSRPLLCGLLRCSNSWSTSRHMSSLYGGRRMVTVLPGHGIGPEMMAHVERVFASGNVPIDFEHVNVDDTPESIDNALKAIRRNGVAIKGNIETDDPFNVEPRNQLLRHKLQLYVNVVRCRSQQGVRTRHRDIDLVVIRQNTEGEYSCLEHESVPGVVESLKIITREKSAEVAKFAFEYARNHKRKKVTIVHKANIMKLSDGLFLQTCRDVAKNYPEIVVDDVIIDNCAMQLVYNPSRFDVMLVPNLYGNVVVNVACGLVGGPGITSGSNYGKDYAVFETATRNTGAKLVGRNVANPTATLLASVEMLKHLGLRDHAVVIGDAIEKTMNDDCIHTPDLGGVATTSGVVDNIVMEVQRTAAVPYDMRSRYYTA